MNIDKLPIGYLRTFVLIVEGNDVSACIRPTTTSKTTAYNQIAAIEKTICAKLFNGGYRKENLTPVGRETYFISVNIIKNMDLLISNVLSGGIINNEL